MKTEDLTFIPPEMPDAIKLLSFVESLFSLNEKAVSTVCKRIQNDYQKGSTQISYQPLQNE